MKDLTRVRRDALKRLIDEHGVSSLAKRLKLSGPSYLSQLVSGKAPFTEKAARKLETGLGIPLGALDTPPGELLPFAGTDTTLIADAVRAVGEEAERTKIPLPPRKFAEAVSMVYERSVPVGKIDLQYVAKLIKLLA
jgi:hypothetical protein